MTNPISFPCPEEGLRLHARLLEADPTAWADVCKAYCNPLTTWLQAAHPRDDPHLVQDAIHEAILAYLKKPESFNPQFGDLGRYLQMAARRDLANLLCKERRRHSRQSDWEVVEVAADGGNSSQDDSPPLLLIQEEDAASAREAVQRVRELCTPEEQAVLDLILAEERRTEAFAAVLGLETRPAAEQKRMVKQVKDRLKKRLERGGEGP